MNGFQFHLSGARLIALPSGALWWRDDGLLCVSDLHLGKSDRLARGGRGFLPPYETRDTLARLEAEILATGAKTVVCLGDSFDDLTAATALNEADRLLLIRLQAGRRWIWIEGNHDPGPVDLGGEHLAEFTLAPLTFRHIALPAARAEISGHYHPKAKLSARGRSLSRACFLADDQRLILPAFGTYTGGLQSNHAELCTLMRPDARAILLADPPVAIPMPRG